MSDDRPDSPDQPGSPSQNSTATSHSHSRIPTRIGAYRILQKIGEGGMGVVYEAEQEKPVRRKVALKIVKWGMDTNQVIARFEAERQALALMNHPNVAKVLDAGATEQGRPYFVMELVKGVPITDHCDRHRLITDERLKLFMQVCEGVQHAHQKGIIHRDIKPSNILVEVRDGNAVPKIIDFGVAKATEHRLTERTLFTELGQLVGTPEYMSPEQAEMTHQDIDTRTDVYSLGVVLYELLVGALPFDAKELRQAGFDEIRRQIREQDPSKPSTRLNTLDDDISVESARLHGVDVRTLQRQLRGDLDWVTMKALEKDRTRRYDSPNEIAADIRRHLKHEPVEAGPPSTLYRARKFIRRHRVGVALGAAALVVLMGFVIRERLHAAQIVEERDRANEAATTAEQVSEFLVGLFMVSDPGEARGNTITAREILDEGAEKIERELQDQPPVRARMMDTMGRVYHNLGLYKQAESLLTKSVSLRREVLGRTHWETVNTMIFLGASYGRQDRYEEAEALFAEAWEIRRDELGEDHWDTLYALHNLGWANERLGRYAEAEHQLRRALEGRRRIVGEDHSATVETMANLGMLYQSQGRYAESEPMLVAALEYKRRAHGDDHPDTLMLLHLLATQYAFQSRTNEAAELFHKIGAIKRRVLGVEHRSTLLSINNEAAAYHALGKYGQAEALFREAIPAARQSLGQENPLVLLLMGNLGATVLELGHYEEAEELISQAVEGMRRSQAAGSQLALELENYLGDLYRRRGHYDESRELLERVLEGRLKSLDENHWYVGASHYQVGCLAAALDDRDVALEHFREALAAGWAKRTILEDKDLDSLRGDPEFEAIVAEVKKRLGEE
jgi:non-specific serine/threonine protein kinase/serine/threonine-protein kinase